MIRYNCPPCEFVTFRKGEFAEHQRTKKHQRNCPEDAILPIKSKQVTESFKCSDCQSRFESEGELKEHVPNCPVALRIKVLLLEKELELSNKFQERYATFIEGENQYHKDSLDKQVNTVNKITTGAIKYLQQHCPNAPRLEAPDDYDSVWEDLEEKEIFLKRVWTWHSKKDLALELSQRLLTIYQKKDATEQSLWGVDSSRTNYAEKEEDWIIDKEGAKIRKKIIIPFIDDLTKRVKNKYNYGKKHELITIDEYNSLLSVLVNEKEELIKKMLKRMCAELYLNKEGVKKNGKFLTYVEPEKEEKADEVGSESPKRIKKSTPKKKPAKIESDSDDHLIDSSDHPSDSDQCDKSYERIKNRPLPKPAPKKEIVIIDTKKKGKRV